MKNPLVRLSCSYPTQNTHMLVWSKYILRWMVRPNQKGVDFGLWQEILPAQLSCPLDVHSGNVARKLKLLKRKQNDAKALAELDVNLRKMDANDPVKYDFALFGLGVFEKF